MTSVNETQLIDAYRKYAQQILKYCVVRVRMREDAEDITSRTFEKAWIYARDGNTIDNIRAFLFRIAHNLVVDYYKSAQRTHEISLDSFETPPEIQDDRLLTDEVVQRNLIDGVRQDIDKLPEQYREIVIMRYVNDLTIEEIASALKISLNNASVRLHRATERLKSFATSSKQS